jgi:hypothetical protein
MDGTSNAGSSPGIGGWQCDVSNLLLALRQDVAFRLKGAAESDLRRSEVEQHCV